MLQHSTQPHALVSFSKRMCRLVTFHSSQTYIRYRNKRNRNACKLHGLIRASLCAHFEPHSQDFRGVHPCVPFETFEDSRTITWRAEGLRGRQRKLNSNNRITEIFGEVDVMRAEGALLNLRTPNYKSKSLTRRRIPCKSSRLSSPSHCACG